jgi:(S)-citramalyl-CoA lyase
MINLAPIRSILFCPADKVERFEKVALSGADAIAIDLEDAVGLAKKDQARRELLSYLAQHGRVPGGCDFRTIVRINSLLTRAGIDDLHALLSQQIVPHALMLPKVESAFEVRLIATQLRTLGKPCALIAFIETARGLQHAADIAHADPMLQALAFGGADLSADLGSDLAWEPLLSARHAVIAAAASNGLYRFDVPWIALDDEAGLIDECRRARALGFSGKLAIHPKQVHAINAAFTPTDLQRERATRILDAFTAAQGSVCEVDGKMIDEPLVRMARQVLSRVP